jgi:cyclophilin family peptidyl-prolyl cis-trans isomerase
MKQIILIVGLISAAFPTLNFAADAPPAASGTTAASSGAGAAAASGAAAKTKTAAAATTPAAPATQVRVVTSMGSFIIELNAERAPLTVPHFLKFVDQGHYTGTIFHRVISNFVIQGGGFDKDYKPTPAPSKVVNESGNGLNNVRGTVGMARGEEPHGSDVQFYVNLYDNEALDPSQTRWGYAVFGKVVQGMDVVDKIGNVATITRGAFKDTPAEPVVIERIERVATP